MLTTLEVGRGEFRFSAAHNGLHDGELETLHGHTFVATLRLLGSPGDDGMLVDFGVVKQALRQAIAPLHRRTLMPGLAAVVDIAHTGDTAVITCGRKRYVFPVEDVVVLPLTNTSTEAIATYLLDRVLEQVPTVGLSRAELELSEAPDQSATARVDLADPR